MSMAIEGMTEIGVSDLRASFRGELIHPGDGDYEAARRVYNGMIDRRPGLIARCVDVADVIAAVSLARDGRNLLAVRGGGHNGPGLGVCDQGVVIDLSRLRGIRVDPTNKTVRVEGGCVWGDVDHATHAFGLAVPSGYGWR
jgi:FAD/FMN-containing dehydrogenase